MKTLNPDFKGCESVLVSPPSALTKLGVMNPGGDQLVQAALCAFKDSPWDLEETRDAVLRDISVSVSGKQVRLSQPTIHL